MHQSRLILLDSSIDVCTVHISNPTIAVTRTNSNKLPQQTTSLYQTLSVTQSKNITSMKCFSHKYITIEIKLGSHSTILSTIDLTTESFLPTAVVRNSTSFNGNCF